MANAKLNEKEEAIRLRLQGESYSYICEKLKISQGSASLWLRDYKLSDTRRNQLFLQRNRKAGETNKKRNDIRREQYRSKGKQLIIDSPGFRDICLLYWGEGTKNPRGGKFCLANSDPKMLKFVLCALSKINHLKPIKIVAYIHQQNDASNDEAIDYWRSVLGVKDVTIYRTKISRASQQKLKNKLLYGTVNIEINSTEFLHYVLGGIDYLKENGTREEC